MRIVSVAILSGISLLASVAAEASCSRCQPNCQGNATFLGGPTWRCFSIRAPNGQTNFCTAPDSGNHTVYVVSGERYCWWERNEPLPAICKTPLLAV